jgi:AcrR family transcriptional regulator
MFSQKGYAATTLDDIARKAGIHAPNLYYYFENKDAIVEALLKFRTEQLQAAANEVLEELRGASPLEQLKGLVRRFIADMTHRTEFGRAFEKIYDQVSPELRKRSLAAPRAFARVWERLIGEAIAAGELRSDVSPRLFRLALIGSMRWMNDWYKPGGPNTPEEIADEFITIFLEGAALAPRRRSPVAPAPGRGKPKSKPAPKGA